MLAVATALSLMWSLRLSYSCTEHTAEVVGPNGMLFRWDGRARVPLVTLCAGIPLSVTRCGDLRARNGSAPLRRFHTSLE